MQIRALCNLAGILAPAWQRSKRWLSTKTVLVMKITTSLILAACLQVSAKGVSQTVTFSGKNVSLQKVFTVIKKQTGYAVMYNADQVEKAKPVNVTANNTPLETFLRQVLIGQPFEFSIENTTIFISRKISYEVAWPPNQQPASITDAASLVFGRIINEFGKPLSGASIKIKGSKEGTNTDADGRFTLNANDGDVLVISYVGYLGMSVRITQTNNVTTAVVVSSDRQQSSGTDADATTAGSGNRQRNGIEDNGAANTEGVPALLNSSINSLLIKLYPAVSFLDEVVVAYGTVKKGEHTGSSAMITAKDIERRPIVNVANAIVGAAPGIQSTTPGGAPGSTPGIMLRGFGSINASSSPLYVVDGIVYNAGLANLSSDDIESISVLKDASTTALYGARGGNGVIMITTKKGRKSSNSLSIKVQRGYTSRAIPEYDRLHADEWYPLMWQSYKNNMVYASGTNAVPEDVAAQLASGLVARNANGLQVYNGKTYSDIYQLVGYNPYNVASTSLIDASGNLNANAKLLYADDLDWEKAFMGTGKKEDYSIIFNGGNDKSDYSGSMGYNNEEGFAVNSYFKRYVGRLGINTNPVNWFKTGLNIAGTYAQSNNAAESGIANPFSFSRNMGPVYPVFAHDAATGEYLLDASGNKIYDAGDYGTDGTRPVNAGRHAIWENLLNEDRYKRTYLSGRAYADVNFFPGLTGTVKIGADFQDYLGQTYQNKEIGDGAPGGRSSRTNTRILSYTFTQYLTYVKKLFEDHNINLLAGHENYDYTYNYLYAMRQEQIVDGNTEFDNFTTTSSLTSETDKYAIESYFGRLNYDYQGKYIATASIRRDGNSRFKAEYRWENFWSLGLAWRLDREDFMKTLTFIDELKLRFSTGRVGNDQLSSYYAYQSLYDLGYNNGSEPGYIIGSLGNDELTWESSKSNDFGVDFSLFKNRISGSIEYFNRVSDRLLFEVDQPLSAGGTPSGPLTITRNIGSLYNRGIEVSLTGTIVRKADFSYSVTVNATSYKNKVTEMPPSLSANGIISSPHKILAGHSRYEYYLRNFYGVDPADGMALYSKPVTYSTSNSRLIDNGKGGYDTVTTLLSNATQLYTGKTSIPDVYGSIRNDFSYKNFDLSFTFLYSIGGWAYDGEYAGLMHAGNYGYALHKDALKAWKKAGDVTTVPRMESNNNSNFSGTSDRWLIKADYISLNNITVGYTFKRNVLGMVHAKSARLYLSGENVFWLTKRKGMNPANAYGGTQSSGYPPARIVSAGFNVNF